MKTIRITVSLLFFASLLCSCGPMKEDANHHATIRFVNKSDVLIYINWTGPINDQDTTYRFERGNLMLKHQGMYKIYPDNENRDALYWRGYYEDILPDKAQRHSDKVMVFIFDAKQLEANPSDINNAVIQRYDLTLADLRYLNWTLTYPPTPEMSTIKMYPPYKQTE